MWLGHWDLRFRLLLRFTRAPDKSVLRECPTRVSDTEECQCPTRASHKSVLPGCPTRVSYRSVLQECSRRVSVLQGCPTRVTYKSVAKECPTRVSYMPQECPTRVSYKRVSKIVWPFVFEPCLHSGSCVPSCCWNRCVSELLSTTRDVNSVAWCDTPFLRDCRTLPGPRLKTSGRSASPWLLDAF